MNFDTIISNALIYDGSGRIPYRNDVGIKADRIAAIGDLSKAEAETRIDAAHLALSPGFIDVHSHADMTSFKKDHKDILEPLVRQGITTFVGGNCGVGMAPFYEDAADIQKYFYQVFIGEDPTPDIHWNTFGEMLDKMEENGLVLNQATLAGHGILRMNAMGDSTDLAKPEDIRKMQKILAECLEGGAIGLSTGLMYFPGLSSDQWELTQLGRTVHDYNGVFTSHLRSYNSDTMGKAIDEVVSVGKDAEVPVQISHLFCIPNTPEPLATLSNKAVKGLSKVYNYKKFPMKLDFIMEPHMKTIDDLASSGYPIGADAMPTSAGFTHLLAFFPPWSLMGGKEVIKQRLMDPAQRKEIRSSIENGDVKWPHRGRDSWSMNFFKVMGWDCAFIMSVFSEKNQHLSGKSIAEIGEAQGKHPFDAACDLLLEEDFKVLIFETVTFPGDPLLELSQHGAMKDPNVSIVTDTILLGFGLPSHLFYDCYPKFLSHYVREEKMLSMAEAIRRCTTLPAKQMQLRDRGAIKEGYFADLVLFDEKNIGTNSTTSDPAHFPKGVEYVLINGHKIVDPDGFHPNPLPGHVIRRGQ